MHARRLVLRFFNALLPGRGEPDLTREISSHLGLLDDARVAGTANGLQGGSFTLFSYDLYRVLRYERIFDGLCAVQSSKSRVTVRRPGVNETEPAFARLVSANYFDVLGTRPALGRVLGPTDAEASAPPVAVISYR